MTRTRTAACAFALSLVPLCGLAYGADDTTLVDVDVSVQPIIYLVFDIEPPLLALEIPPPASTAPSTGVFFTVYGNTIATLTAEPDSFIEVPGEGFMGKAVLATSEVGYKLDLRFPRTGSLGPPPSAVQTAALPGYAAGPTTPPLSVDLVASGGARGGVLNMETSEQWTADGSLPTAGLHIGEVVLTLSALP